MKHLILFLFLSLSFFIQTSAQNYWIRISSPTTHNLSKFVFTDIQNGWAVGDSGTIIHTSTGGMIWVLQNSTYSVNNYFRDIYFLNQRLGWCITSDYYHDYASIIKTTDGGNNWLRVSNPDSSLATIYFTDSLNGFLGDWYGKIFKTTNGGDTWFEANVEPSPFNFHSRLSFRFYNSQYGLVSGGFHEFSGLIYRTTNSGFNWTICDSALNEPINDMCYVDSNYVLGTGGDYEFGVTYMISNDRGLSWRNIYLPYFGFGKGIAPRTYGEIWIAMGPNQKWAASFDSTKTWNAFQVPDSVALNYCKFIDSKHGWTVGGKGAIFKYDTSMIGVRYIGDNVAIDYKLYQNFPNPFNPTTTINYQIPATNFVKLSVFDVLGKEIAILVNGKQNAGTYRVGWDASHYPSGVYFYRLSTPSFSVTKKMVITK